MSTDTSTMQELELESAELLPSRETLCCAVVLPAALLALRPEHQRRCVNIRL